MHTHSQTQLYTEHTHLTLSYSGANCTHTSYGGLYWSLCKSIFNRLQLHRNTLFIVLLVTPAPLNIGSPPLFDAQCYR